MKAEAFGRSEEMKKKKEKEEKKKERVAKERKLNIARIERNS
jgi:hypothetical protein